MRHHCKDEWIIPWWFLMTRLSYSEAEGATIRLPLFINIKLFNDLRVFNTSTSKWNHIQCNQGPCPRYGHQANIYEDIMLVSGGCDGLNVLKEVWLYLIDQK